MSQETADPERKPKEIKDSYEDEQSPSNESGRIRVEIPVDQGFDREAYARVAVVSSQPSQATQPSQYSQSSRPSHTTSLSQFKNPTRRPYIWDEEDGVPIIPDSPKLSRSSSYKPTQTPTSKTGASTPPNTGTNTEADLASWTFSGGRFSRGSEPLSYLSKESNLEGQSLAASSQADRSLQPSSTSVEDSQAQESHHLQQPSGSESVEDSIISAISRARPNASISAGSSRLPSLSEIHLSSLTRGTWSQEAAHIIGQAQSCQPSSSAIGNDSQLQFQTQLPSATLEGDNSQNTNLHVIQGYVISPLKSPRT